MTSSPRAPGPCPFCSLPASRIVEENAHAVLILDGLDVHVPKPYIYAAMGFSVLVEWLNLLMRRRAREHNVPGAGNW